ncbi:Uma2 family endonuclease [Armatimonas sp.]|uniref:Uma2 family endonuclease n=1 Tax=Armatimonas sp. TaxID=1872638 RepID=UPI003750C92B
MPSCTSSLSAGTSSEPEPDAAVTLQPAEVYLRAGIPPGSEFRLVVEVSDSTLWRDKGQKAKLYAAAGVPEYWVVNLTGRTVIVHRRPVGDDYQSIVTYNENETISPEGAPEHTIALAEILPPIMDETL